MRDPPVVCGAPGYHDARMTLTDHAIVPLGSADEHRIAQVSELLVRSFRDLSPTWVPTVEAAREKVMETLAPWMIARVLIVEDRVAGFVGARPNYSSVWELHPLVVDEAVRYRGYGRLLVTDIEGLVAEEGALTLLLGTSDEVSRTSLAGQDLFKDPIGALRDLTSTDDHPLGFWKRVGYTVVGLVPDAEGLGKPTILLAKSVGQNNASTLLTPTNPAKPE